MRCPTCNNLLQKSTGEINRANKLGLKLYCNRTCAGIGRRKSLEQKKERTWWYDAFNRLALADGIKQKKADYFKRDYATNPEKYAAERRRKKQWHAEYIRSARYRKWKADYDQQYLAQKKYGEHAESILIIWQIESLIDTRQARQDRNCHNKTQQRKRLWKSLQRSI